MIIGYWARITYFFHNLLLEDYSAVNLYLFGSFFPALAARNRVKKGKRKSAKVNLAYSPK
jgi:hypothetical protein